jgi:glycosyltransferase 2 family protein
MTTDQPINKPSFRGWYLALTIIIAAILLVLAIRGVSWQEMLVTLQKADSKYLAFYIILGSFSVFFRGLRWGVLLSAEKKISALTMFWATAVGYVGNTFLPARAGEVIRSVMLGEKTGIAKSYVLATALRERIFDVITLVLIGVLAVPSIGNLPEWLPQAMRVMGILGLAALILLLLAPRMRDFITSIVNKVPFPEKWRETINKLLQDFLLGASAFIHPGRAAGFLGLSAIVWILDASAAVLLSLALNLNFSYPQAFLLLVAMGLASAIPSTPGYVGIYQYVAVTLLPIYGATRSEALTYILAMQAANTCVILLWGFIGLWRLNIGKKKVTLPVDPPLV